MEYTITYKQSGYFKKYVPVEIKMFFSVIRRYWIEAKPFSSHGCQLRILGEDEGPLFFGEYSYMTIAAKDLHTTMASELSRNINLILEIEEVDEKVQPSDFEVVMAEIVKHSEFMDANEVAHYGYSAIITFE